VLLLVFEFSPADPDAVELVTIQVVPEVGGVYRRHQVHHIAVIQVSQDQVVALTYLQNFRTVVLYLQVTFQILEVIDEGLKLFVLTRIEAKVLIFRAARPLEPILHLNLQL